MGQQYLNPIVRKAKDWRRDSGILLVGVCLVQIFDIDRISSYILVLPFACLATNNLGWWPYELWISLLYGSHKFLHVIPQGVTLMPQDECKVDMAQRRSACTNSQNRGAFLRTFSASDLSSRKTSLLRNQIIRSIQLGPILTWWTQIIFPLIPKGLHRSSMRITRGKFCAEEVASVARESAWVFPLLGMCYRLNDSNFSYRCLI